MKWRDLLRELLHNRLDMDGLLGHPLYQGIDLDGIDRLNHQFTGLTFDFREYLFIHAMSHRLLEKDARAFAQWRNEFLRIDAAATAFRFQLEAERAGHFAAQALVSQDPNADAQVQGLPLMKFVTPHSGPLVPLSRDQLLDQRHLLGRLLNRPRAHARTDARSAAQQRQSFRRAARGYCGMARGIATSRLVRLSRLMCVASLAHELGSVANRSSEVRGG